MICRECWDSQRRTECASANVSAVSLCLVKGAFQQPSAVTVGVQFVCAVCILQWQLMLAATNAVGMGCASESDAHMSYACARDHIEKNLVN